MELHNISEDIVFGAVQKIFDSIVREGNPEGLCLCEQCKMDTVCYVLNRVEPRYIISSRGINHFERDWVWRQQMEIDVATLAYKGLRLVNHKLRPTAAHDGTIQGDHKISNKSFFDIPTIIGRLFDGKTFSPLDNVKVELWGEGELVPMRNQNWPNPFTLVPSTPGTYTFWPAPVVAEGLETNRFFEYILKVADSQYEPIEHYFKVPAVSDNPWSVHSSGKTIKLPDLYLFPPGESEING